MTSPSVKRLIHLANFNSTNVGNGALVSGLESTLQEDVSFDIQWGREAWDDYTFRKLDFDEVFVDKINASDGLVVGGAVTFNGRDYNDRTGTRFELPFELWDKIKKPVVFYGLSYRHWPGQTYHHADKLKVTIEKILSSDNMLLSLRNDGTKQWLKDITGIDSPDILEVPDPGVFVKVDVADYPEIIDGVCNIMVSFNNEDDSYRYLSGGPTRESVVGYVASALEELATRLQLNIILCPHYFDDFRMMSAFVDRIKPHIAHQSMVTTGLSRTKDTPYFYGRYARADLAISMRVHSMSPCIGLGVPMVALTTQGRMSDFISNLGLQSQAVDAFDPNAASKLFEKMLYTLEHSNEVKQKFSVARSNLRKQAHAFHQRLEKIFADSV